MTACEELAIIHENVHIDIVTFVCTYLAPTSILGYLMVACSLTYRGLLSTAICLYKWLRMVHVNVVYFRYIYFLMPKCIFANHLFLQFLMLCLLSSNMYS